MFSVAQASSTIVYIKESKEEVTPHEFPPPEDLFFIDKSKPHEFVRASVSAYTSSVDETDETPDVNARGYKPGPGSIACPTRYKFGTEVIINKKTYVCDDRMSPRLSGGDYFDVWMTTKEKARQWGRRTVTVEIVL